MSKLVFGAFVLSLLSLPAQAQRGQGMGPGMMMGGQGMMGPGMMQGGMMGGGMCAGMAEGDIKVETLKNGARITITSGDKNVVSRIQKRAKIMELNQDVYKSYQSK